MAEKKIIYQILILSVFSIIGIITNIKELLLTNDFVIYKLPIIRKEWTVFYTDFINVTLKLSSFNRKGQYMNLEINYYDVTKKKNNNFFVPVRDAETAKRLCHLFLEKGINIVTNDDKLQAIISLENRKVKR